MNTSSAEFKKYLPAIYLDSIASRNARRTVRVFQLALAGATGLSYLFLEYVPKSIEFVTIPESFFTRPNFYLGIFFLTLSSLLIFYLISFFYNTLFYRGLDSIIAEHFIDESGLSFEVASMLEKNTQDITSAFFTSEYGKLILYRSGVDASAMQRFLGRSDRKKLPVEAMPLPPDKFVTLEDAGLFIYKNDTEFHQFILNQGKNDEMFHGALRWVSRSHLTQKYTTKWWSRDNLGKRSGLGRELSFGVAYELQRYMKPIATSAVFSLFSRNSAYANELIEKIETALSRTKAANVMLIGEPGVGKIDILIELGKRMQEGTSSSSILGKKLIVFDGSAFIATHNTKEEFEINFLRLFSQAAKAGNIIIVIENIASFIASIEGLGSDATDLLDRFLASPVIQVVATSDPDSYHDFVERKGQFMSRFEPVLVENPTLDSTIRVLEGVAETHEATFKIFFTYPAIEAIAQGADQYIVEGVMPDKAISLLSEVAALAQSEHVSIISKTYTETAIAKKTGIPVGPVDEKEKEKLLHLEDHLHKRVVGQHSAIAAIASALRRSRAGIQTKERPLGTFLFLGSTGVGKTETAKALADVFFESEDKMLRLDMTEYSGDDALMKLIGDHQSSGSLPVLLRSHPYGVLLLDEFEKASSEIHDMFLQILDEGVFTDGRGKRVNARNIIFIATSNAGSDMIWKMTAKGQDPSESKEIIVDSIIQNAILKPELINRFDAVVIFKTLREDEQRKIARLMLESLAKRIEQKGYVLSITDDLVDVLAEKGFDPEFGARPMRRVLQDEIEEKIASKIISGNLQYGGEISFTRADFEDAIKENLPGSVN